MTTEFVPGQKIYVVYCTSVYKPNIVISKLDSVEVNE